MAKRRVRVKTRIPPGRVGVHHKGRNPNRTPPTRYDPIARPFGDSGEEVGRGKKPPPGQGGPPPTAGQGGGGTGTGEPPNITWFPGLPPDLAKQVAEYLRTHPDDQDGAMALIRASDWYSHEYAGIQYGIQNGLFDAQHPEEDYRAWKNQVKDTYARQYGQALSEEQLTLYLYHGWTPQRIEQVGQGQAWTKSQGGEAQYALGAFGGGRLTQEQLAVLGQQEAGINSDMGLSLHNQLQAALEKVQKVFSGSQGSGFSLNQSLGDVVQRRSQSDIGA